MIFSAYRDYKRQMALEQMEREEKAAEGRPRAETP